jgi:hypothetical protein
LVAYGEKFISSIRDKRVETSSDASSRLNSLSGLNVLSHRISSSSQSISNPANSVTKLGDEESSEAGSIPTLPVGPQLARFVGGAAVTRINVLTRLNQFLDQLTSGHGNAETIKASIRDGSDINSKNKANKTALCVAAEKGRLDAVMLLIAAKADIEIRDQEDQTVLHLAARAGSAELVRTLVNSKADVNARNKTGKTPFELATNDECKYALKKMGAGGWTALMVAAERGDDRVEQYFYLRECILCMAPIWTWVRHCEEVVLSDDGKAVSKEGFGSGYFCVLGSDEFVDRGVYVWEISVDGNFRQNVWAGIARGIHSLGRLDLSPENCECDLLVAFESNGKFVAKGGASIKSHDGEIGWFNQPLLFKLDMFDQTLELLIGGMPAFVASDFDCDRVRPYLCLEGQGKITLNSRKLQIKKFPAEFQDDVRFYSSLNKKDSLWAWGLFKHDDIALNDLEIKKVSHDRQFACAVGNEEFAKGVHTWKISVDRQYRVWLGVIRGNLEADDLVASPDRIHVDFVFVFCSDGQGECYKGRSPVINTISGAGEWSAQQEITLKLDMHKHTLEISTNEQLVCTASDLDDRGLRPYVCIEFLGSATLESRESFVVNSNSSMISFKDRAVGLDNAQWGDEELNNALLAFPMAGNIDIHPVICV